MTSSSVKEECSGADRDIDQQKENIVMKRLLGILALSLFLGCLSTFAGAYIIQGMATAPGYQNGTAVVFGTASTPHSALLLPPPGGVQLAVVEDSKLYQTLIKTTDPGRWDLRVLVDPGFVGDSYAIEFWSTDAPGVWKLVSNGETLWTGSLEGTIVTNPALDLTLPYSSVQQDFSLIAVPEPGSMAVLFSGLAGFAGLVVRRRK